MFATVPEAMLALSMTVFEIVSDPVVVILDARDAVWSFHPAGGDEPS